MIIDQKESPFLQHQILAVCVVGIHAFDSSEDTSNSSDQLSTPVKFLRDVMLIAEELKQITNLKKKAVFDAISALGDATLGVIRDLKTGKAYLLKSIINGTETALATKLALIQSVLSSIFAAKNYPLDNSSAAPSSPLYGLLSEQGIQRPENPKDKIDELEEIIKRKYVLIPAPENGPLLGVEEYRYKEPNKSEPKADEITKFSSSTIENSTYSTPSSA